MRIAIVTDAWYPQVNGVVRTLNATREHLESQGHQVFILAPDEKLTLPCPTYSEIRLSLTPYRRVSKTLLRLKPDSIHIATEGPLGWAARYFCKFHDYDFTTAFHTKFPEYVHARTKIPEDWTYGVLRRFHRPSSCTMVTTQSMEESLAARGFSRLRRWGRGVDLALFGPQHRLNLDGKSPVLLYVGRVAIEKNLEAFLSLDVQGTKYVVGDGPQLAEYRAKYPQVHFVGPKFGQDLAEYYASADVFVFPSRTDTFGLVMIEALASGTPVAAFPVTGPIDILNEDVGCMHEDLGVAVAGALSKSRNRCHEYAQMFSWENAAAQFVENLVPA
ncbi:MAG: glycosyltransferase family 1 protein [Pseudobdellovibrionaceae bacterium]|nr:glycosyltransferase family 1 protein [Bdellovibrionales bacterium]USN49000.1 MAG: glycosyltransferase family 1 protein [Pseudobdellovibrionaceae bacterium]